LQYWKFSTTSLNDMISREKKFGHIAGLVRYINNHYFAQMKTFFAIRYAKTYYFRDVVSFRWTCCKFSILLISIKGQKNFLSWPQYKRLIPPGPSRLLGSVVYSLSVTGRLRSPQNPPLHRKKMLAVKG
jgi:E3 ubiquitin-protein ligase DOA10